MSPAEAAPGDPVRFELLVPNERPQSTVEIRLKIPSDVLPFSYEEPAGWKRHLELARNGAPDVVRWRGRLASDGFARFGFLATTPSRPGTLAWKAIQTYGDGRKVSWIGAPGSESPAAVTLVKTGVPRQNAGGEGRPTGAPASETAPAPASEDGGDDGPLALILAVAGLVLGATALVLTLRRSRAT
jgi:uncharacterized protein YcnI